MDLILMYIIVVFAISEVTPNALLPEASPFSQERNVEWGSSITLPCFDPVLTQDSINRDECMVYWRKNGEDIATFFMGIFDYDNGSLELGHDMALTIKRADWVWQGVVECKYNPKCDINYENDLDSMIETHVNLNVEGSPLCFRNCCGSSAEDRLHNDPCTLRVFHDTVTVDLTFVKEGALYDAVHFRRELVGGMRVTSQSNLDRVPNSDNSTTLQVSFKVNVESLKESGEFTFILEDKDGRALEETTVVLNKQSSPEERGSSSSANYASVSLMACMFGLMLIS